MVGTPHCARITVGWTYLDTAIQAENVFYLQDPTDAIFASPALTAAAVNTAVISDLVPVSEVQVIYNQVGFEDVRTVPFGGLVFSTGPHPGTGGFGGAALPPDVALAIKKGTGGLGRSARGRWYFPVANTANLLHPSEVKPTWATAIVNALVNFQATVEAMVANSRY